MVHYTTYTEDEILPTANIMINYLLKPPKHENFYKKYANKKYYKVSPFFRLPSSLLKSHLSGKYFLQDLGPSTMA